MPDLAVSLPEFLLNLAAVPGSSPAATGTVGGLITYISIALGVSFICSILEAVLLSTTASHVELEISRGKRAAERMRTLSDSDHIDRSIAAILTLNTIAHTVGAAGAGAQAAAVFGSEWIGLIGAVLTILILVVSEIIPKTIGAVHWKPLMPLTAHSIHVLSWTLAPILGALQFLTDILKPKKATPTVTRSELEILARLGHQEGSIDEREMRVVRNLLRLDRVQAKNILTPRTVLFTLPATSTVSETLSGSTLNYSRIPLIDSNADAIESFVLRYDILEAATNNRESAPLTEFARPLRTVPATISVAGLLETFVREQEHILLVIDEYGGTAGIVTLEDAIECLLGAEITDESDLVTDLQELARRRAERRRPPFPKPDSPPTTD